MKGTKPIWAVLASLTVAELYAIMSGELEWSEGRIEALELLACSQGYTGVVCFEPGSENGPDLELAQASSANREKTVYHLLLHPGYAGSKAVFSYRDGRLDGALEESAWRFAANMGLSLDLGHGSDEHQACLIELGTQDEVVAVLTSPSALDQFQVEENEHGLAIYGGESALMAGLLRKGLPARTLYTVAVEHAPMKFSLRVYKPEGGIEVFEHPARTSDPIAELLSQNMSAGSFQMPSPTLDEVFGETDPLAIVAKLGLDPARLGLV
ncbi:MAG: hypothetical protein GY906_13910 [bacterium]|nr:hypothetical protein [bacterium]